MILSIGIYTSPRSDLLVNIKKVYYQNEKYAKVKYSLSNKRNGIVYEISKTNKLYKENLTEWELK